MEPGSLVTEFAGRSTIHGLKECLIEDERPTKRYFFIFLFLLTLGGFAFHLVSLFVAMKPTVVYLSSKRESRYEYPTVRFCPRQWIDESSLINQNISEDAFLFALSLLLQVNVTKNISGSVARAEDELRDYMRRKNISDFLQVYPHLAYEPDKILTCIGCKRNQTAVMFVTAEGVCYDFMFSKLLHDPYDKYPKAGFTYFQQPGTWYGSVYHGEYQTHTLYVGEGDQDFVGHDPIFIDPKTFVVLTITMQLRRHLPVDGFHCYTDEQLPYRKYPSSKMCLADCRAWVAGLHCRGSVPLGYFTPDVKKGSPKLYTSLNDTKTRQEMALCYDEMKPAMESCFNACYSRCNRMVFAIKARVSNAHDTVVYRRKEETMQSEVFNHVRKWFIDNDTNENNGTTVAFLISVRNGLWTQEELTTWSPETLISNIGGIVNLWVGASVLSIFQAIVYCMRRAGRKVREEKEVEIFDMHF